jgi:N4-gp56 family major capsid protein
MNTGTGQVTNAVNNYYDRLLLERAVPSFIQNRYADIRDIPQGNTNIIKFRRYTNLVAKTTPLVEGVTPLGSQLAITDLTATVQQYGDYVTLTDFLEMTTQDPVLNETAELQGDQVGDTLDQLTRDVLAGGTNQYFQSPATSPGTVTSAMKPVIADFKNIVKILKENQAKRITEMLDPSTGLATQGIMPAYIGFVHTDTTRDLKDTAGFFQIASYPRPEQIMPDEVGAMDEVRLIESSNCKILAGVGVGGIDVYLTVVIAKHAYAITRISGEALHMIIKPLGSAGTADPIDQRSTSGWKATHVTVRLNESWMIGFYHATSSS